MTEWRLDVARVIDRIDGGALPLDVLGAVDTHADAAQEETETNAGVTICVAPSMIRST